MAAPQQTCVYVFYGFQEVQQSIGFSFGMQTSK